MSDKTTLSDTEKTRIARSFVRGRAQLLSDKISSLDASLSGYSERVSRVKDLYSQIKPEVDYVKKFSDLNFSEGDVLNQISKIEEMPLVESMEIFNGWLLVHTQNLVVTITEEDDGKYELYDDVDSYDLGHYVIGIPFFEWSSNISERIFIFNKTKRHEGGHSHPCVNDEKVCWGNLASDIDKSFVRGELADVVSMSIEFLLSPQVTHGYISSYGDFLGGAEDQYVSYKDVFGELVGRAPSVEELSSQIEKLESQIRALSYPVEFDLPSSIEANIPPEPSRSLVITASDWSTFFRTIHRDIFQGATSNEHVSRFVLVCAFARESIRSSVRKIMENRSSLGRVSASVRYVIFPDRTYPDEVHVVCDGHRSMFTSLPLARPMRQSASVEFVFNIERSAHRRGVYSYSLDDNTSTLTISDLSSTYRSAMQAHASSMASGATISLSQFNSFYESLMTDLAISDDTQDNEGNF